MSSRPFGTLSDGREVTLYTLKNNNDMQVSVMDLGATLVSILVKDKDGAIQDVILGYDTPQEYIDNNFYFGAVIGRSGNRIANGRFTINGKTYQMAINDNDNNLHSGPDGFDSRVWAVKEASDQSVTFAIDSPDGDEGFPGNFHGEITYSLADDGTLALHYTGTSDADTVANMTNHVYFNLCGHASGTILNQSMQFLTEYYTPVVDGQAIPTGEIASVKGTPLDFTTAKPMGLDIESDFQQMVYVGGYDHNFAIAKESGPMRTFAIAHSDRTGITMEASTDRPGFQFYSGNFITPHTGKGGAQYVKRQGFCLESQNYPNSINQEGFEAPLLKAGETYDTTTTYRFYV